MRIFFVTNNYIPYSGGVVSSIVATSDALRSQGHEVFIITLDFLKDQQSDDPHYVIRLYCPIKFTYKKNYMAIPWRPTSSIIQLIKKYTPDIIHVHHPFFLGTSALKAARICNIPCVFTYHTLYEHYAHYVPLIPKHYTKQLIRSLVNRFCNKVDGIITPSREIKEYLINQHISCPIHIIPSPLRSLFCTTTITTRPVATDHMFKLLVVSRFVPEKNIPFIFDIFKTLPDYFILTLIGYGNDYEAMQFLAFNILHLPKNRVIFIHKPAQNDLLNYYRNADLFIFSSTTDTQGIVLAESMSQAVPVIAIDGPGQRDIIINGINGFIINNTQEAATIIIQISQDKLLHNHLRQGALKTAGHYNSNYISQKLINFYHYIINSINC